MKQNWLQEPITGTNLENSCPSGVSKHVCGFTDSSRGVCWVRV